MVFVLYTYIVLWACFSFEGAIYVVGLWACFSFESHIWVGPTLHLILCLGSIRAFLNIH